MGGPICSVLVRERLSDERIEELLDWLYGASDRAGTGRLFHRYDGDAWSFAIGRTDLLGFAGELDVARSFSLALEENRTTDAISWSDGFDWRGRWIDAYVLKQELEQEVNYPGPRSKRCATSSSSFGGVSMASPTSATFSRVCGCDMSWISQPSAPGCGIPTST